MYSYDAGNAHAVSAERGPLMERGSVEVASLLYPGNSRARKMKFNFKQIFRWHQ